MSCHFQEIADLATEFAWRWARHSFLSTFQEPLCLATPLFGQSTQTLANSLAGGNNAGFNPLYQIGGARSIQLALKLQF
jgi:hypothetical protein